ncbi:nucleotidyltransferase domain-containing protein [Euzebya pacifica]|uniref:nucleotidyltransferase domain-containing protein n=1 Tax=Euzebya pacifica TaxID=1608957 RepID=UPI001C1F20BF|nr:nucleotidyltransferase domain-containing protein [Euzebya pacifica]
MASDEVELPSGVTLDSVSAALRAGGAVFAYLHGSRVAGTHRPGSDVDVAAWFGQPTRPWNVELPATVDLLVLDDAGLELAGRVAQHGILILDDDPPARVAWQAETSKRYLDEAHRRRALVETVLHRG